MISDNSRIWWIKKNSVMIHFKLLGVILGELAISVKRPTHEIGFTAYKLAPTLAACELISRNDHMENSFDLI